MRVADSGTIADRSPVEIKIADSNTQFTFSPQSVNVNIINEPATLPLIALRAPFLPVTEGNNAVFTVTTPSVRTTDVTIGVSFADASGRGDYIEETTEYVVLKSGTEVANATITIPTKDVDGAGLDGIIVATLLDGAGYTPSVGSITAYADVRDDDETPATLFVRPPTIVSIKEGENAVFEIARTGKTSGLLTYRYDLTIAGDNLYGGSTSNVERTIADGVSSDTITITTTKHDDLLPDNARITLRLQSNREYSEAAYRLGLRTRFVSVVDDLPQVSLTGPASGTQGHPYVVTVSVSPQQTNPIENVPITVGNSYDGVLTPSLSTTVTIPVSGSIPVTIATGEDSLNLYEISQFADIVLGKSSRRSKIY